METGDGRRPTEKSQVCGAAQQALSCGVKKGKAKKKPLSVS